MASRTHQINARSWGYVVLNILKTGILKTAVMIPQLEINLIDSNKTIILLIMQRM